MHAVPGFRVRVFGWPETWRVVPASAGGRWRFTLILARGSAGRTAPPFLSRTEWEADELADGLATVKEEIRDLAARVHRRAFLVDEEPEETDD